MDKHFLYFLEDYLPNASLAAKQMVDIFFTDPNAALVKSRAILEEIVNSVWQLEKLDVHVFLTISECIRGLLKQSILDSSIHQSFEIIRKAGNKAAHDASFSDMVTAYSVHKELYKVAIWYFELYTHDNRIISPYEVPQPPKLGAENIEEIVQQQLKTIMSTHFNKTINKPSEEISEDDETKDEYNYEQLNGSYLEREINRLNIASAEAVENAHSFSGFKKYLHIKRPIQRKIEEILEQRTSKEESNLILLCGSVGDGKSHLLAYLNEEKKEWISQYTVFNDATESFSPSKTALETLEELLQNFSDQKLNESTEKIIIAINLGVLHNFINREHVSFTYNKLKEFIEASGLFSSNITTHERSGVFDLISFSDYQMYELTANGTRSYYFESLLDKITRKDRNNPFYKAYELDKMHDIYSIVHQNYLFLSNPFVQKQIVQIVIQAIIQYKVPVSSRYFLNFIADILIPSDRSQGVMSDSEKLHNTLPHLLFGSLDRSQMLSTIQKISPIHYRTSAIDELLVKLNTLSEWEELIEEKIQDETAKEWLLPFDGELEGEIFELFIQNFVSILYLTDPMFADKVANPFYEKFIYYLYGFNCAEPNMIREYHRRIRLAIFNWQGSPRQNYIYMNRLENDLAVAQQLKLDPENSIYERRMEDCLETFKPFLRIAFKRQQSSLELEINFTLFVLLEKVCEGYRPNKKDEENATTWSEFLEKLMHFGEKEEELLFTFLDEGKNYALKKEFGGFVFEEVE
ncbi:DNA phosphorothioation-dependent restriction protein DptF [Lysinibacillus fusiformis]|uniref:DNA phosphorothioation-dependent restriction protein DptF n=1 Tax=Lysinibacillus fusiformis TaxID=28031 RepID=UPI0035C13FEC